MTDAQTKSETEKPTDSEILNAAKVLLGCADDIWTDRMSIATDMARSKAKRGGHKYRVIDREGWKAALREITAQREPTND